MRFIFSSFLFSWICCTVPWIIGISSVNFFYPASVLHTEEICIWYKIEKYSFWCCYQRSLHSFSIACCFSVCKVLQISRNHSSHAALFLICIFVYSWIISQWLDTVFNCRHSQTLEVHPCEHLPLSALSGDSPHTRNGIWSVISSPLIASTFPSSRKSPQFLNDGILTCSYLRE